VNPYLKEKSVNYTMVMGTHALAKQYAVEAMPVTLLIDREGKSRPPTSGWSPKLNIKRRPRLF
jgi:thioredoxin-related protein